MIQLYNIYQYPTSNLTINFIIVFQNFHDPAKK